MLAARQFCVYLAGLLEPADRDCLVRLARKSVALANEPHRLFDLVDESAGCFGTALRGALYAIVDRAGVREYRKSGMRLPPRPNTGGDPPAAFYRNLPFERGFFSLNGRLVGHHLAVLHKLHRIERQAG